MILYELAISTRAHDRWANPSYHRFRPGEARSNEDPLVQYSTLIASGGVGILLVAFFLNLIKRWEAESRPYLLANFVGAALSCYASWLIEFVPFVVLEGTWATVALVGLIRVMTKG